MLRILLDPYPKLAQFISTFEEFDGVRKYLAARARLASSGQERNYFDVWSPVCNNGSPG
jgi:hypothetical protein